MPKVRRFHSAPWCNVLGGRSDSFKGCSVLHRNSSSHARSPGDLNLSVDDPGAIPSGLSLVKAPSGSRRRTREGEGSSISGDVSVKNTRVFTFID